LLEIIFTGNTDPNPALKEKIDNSERFDAFASRSLTLGPRVFVIHVAASRLASFASREGTR
jgi:hypothetical protein